MDADKHQVALLYSAPLTCIDEVFILTSLSGKTLSCLEARINTYEPWCPDALCDDHASRFRPDTHHATLITHKSLKHHVLLSLQKNFFVSWESSMDIASSTAHCQDTHDREAYRSSGWCLAGLLI